jgi:site-specific DNA-methyltransferase (adenine-specific)
MIESMRDFIGSNQMMAYLVMMTARLMELHRTLKPAGSLYLHCDPSASHYLKVVLDTIFGAGNFRNEIIWKRKTGRGDTGGTSRRFGNVTDILLFYSKTQASTFNQLFRPNDPEYIEQFFRHTDENGRRYASDNLASPSPRPNLTYEYKGYKPPRFGWAISKEKMERWDKEGRLIFPKTPEGRIRRKRYLDELIGEPIQNLWDDIAPLSAFTSERLGYPTQKPLALLERIIQASSNPGDVVLDPFCGCGTAVVAAEKLKRKWVGIDITHLGITAMKYRLKEAFPGISFKVKGEPTDNGAARQLASEDRYQFQWWALSLIPGAMPLGGREGSREGKKGSDKGVDGVLTFIDDPSGKAKKALIQVKSGHVNSSMIRDLIGTVQRENAAIGVFITLDEPTRDMVTEAVTAGFYNSPGWRQKYPAIQIYTVDELLHHAEVKMPPRYWMGKKAKILKEFGEQKVLDLMPRSKIRSSIDKH